MSETSINRIFEEFAAKVPEACADGRGEALFKAFLVATAAHFAEAIFLKMDAEAGAITSDERAAEVWAWAQVFPHESAIALLEGIGEVLRRFSATPETIERAQEVSAAAYRDRLESLFATSGAGGAA